MITTSELFKELQEFFLEIIHISFSKKYKLFADQADNCTLLLETIIYTDLVAEDKEKVLDYFKDIVDIIEEIGDYFVDLDDPEQDIGEYETKDEEIANSYLLEDGQSILSMFYFVDKDLPMNLAKFSTYDFKMKRLSEKILYLTNFLKRKIS